LAATTSAASGRGARTPAAAPTVVRTSAPESSTGWAGSSEAPVVTTATTGCGGRPRRARSSARASAVGGCARSIRHVPFGEARSVPAPTTTASEQARTRARTNLSASLSSPITACERGSLGTATTPSSDSTKFATTQGSSSPIAPPYSASSSSGTSHRARSSSSARTLKASIGDPPGTTYLVPTRDHAARCGVLGRADKYRYRRSLRPRIAWCSRSGLPAAPSGSPRQRKELGAQRRVLVVQATPYRRHRQRAVLLDAAHCGAHVRGLQLDRDAARAGELAQAVRDLLGEPLLHREAPGVKPNEPRQLRDAEDLVACDVADVRTPVERQGMMLAERVKADRSLDDLRVAPFHALGPLGREERAQLRVAVVACRRVVERAQEAPRRVTRARCVEIQAERLEDLGGVPLEVRPLRRRQVTGRLALVGGELEDVTHATSSCLRGARRGRSASAIAQNS